jgi:hypothetical protein
MRPGRTAPATEYFARRFWWDSPWVAVLLLSALVWLVYGHSLLNGLVFDDVDVIKSNPWIADPGNLRFLFSKRYFDLFGEYSYRPVVTASYFLDCAIAGKQPWIYHLHNVALHNLNVLLTFLLFARLGARQRQALAIAAIVAVHPLQAEAVIFPGFREDLQMTFGMLAMSVCLAFDRERPSAGWMLLAIVALAFALFAKEGAMLLPLAWLAFDARRAIVGPLLLRLARRYIPLVLTVAAYAVVRFAVLTNPGAAELDVIEKLPLDQRLATAPWLFAYYIRRFVWPMPLCIIHDFEPLRAMGPAFYLAMLVVIAVAAAWIALSWKEPWLWLAGLWIAATFASVANIYQIVNLWAERFYYSVNIGMAAIAVAGVVRLWHECAARLEPSRRPVLPLVGWTAGILLLWIAAFLGVVRVNATRDSLSLWRQTVRCAPRHGTAQATLAIEELKAGNLAEAERVARESLKHGGGEYRVNYILGQIAMRRKDYRQAAEHFEAARKIEPPSIEHYIALHVALAQAYQAGGRSEKAIPVLLDALEIAPENETLGAWLNKLQLQPKDAPSTPSAPNPRS